LAADWYNTDDMHEYALDRRYRYWYNRLTRGRLLSHGRGMVYVSGDFAKLPHFDRFAKPNVVIGNGIDLSLYEPLPLPTNQKPHLVYIGSPHQTWHGLDKIMKLAEACPDWQFDIIGSQADELGHRLPPNVQMHGFLARRDYEPLFAQADVALGTLALHRNGFNEASPLKNGEYLAFGLPLIIAHNETNFLQPPSFILQIPNTPDNIRTHLNDIRQFVHAMRGVRVPRSEIAHLDVHQKEQQRLAFFRQMVEHT
jgi:glycosyltransferase involved in cell wall biosynthesis